MRISIGNFRLRTFSQRSDYCRDNEVKQKSSTEKTCDFGNYINESQNKLSNDTRIQQGNNNPDPREAEVAKRLNIPVEQFHALSEQEKAEMVRKYNQEHPNDRIPEKQDPFQNFYRAG